MSALKFAAACGAAAPLYVDDVFSAYTYTGNGSTQTITNGIDLAGKGGMVWKKARTGTYGTSYHHLVDTVRGADKTLSTNVTEAENPSSQTITGFNSNGFNLGTSPTFNDSVTSFISWTFREAPKFFTQAQVTVSGSNQTVDLSSLGTVGMVRVKRTDSAGSWYVWHRSLTAGNLLIGETTAAEATLGHITVSGTTVTLVNGVIADGTYLVEAFAHDTSAEGIIQCGSVSAAGFVDLGWEPQFVIKKRRDGNSEWAISDTSRIYSVSNHAWLEAQSSAAEFNVGSQYEYPTAKGFYNISNSAQIYLAIRCPNKPPTSGTQVYNAIARTGTGAAATVTGVGFAPDLMIVGNKTGVSGITGHTADRLRGQYRGIATNQTQAEWNDVSLTTGFNMDGVSLGSDAFDGGLNKVMAYVNWFFKRAPGVFDIVCYTGTGAAHTEAHNLGVAPELMIVKKRSAIAGWYVYHAGNTANPETDYLVLNTTAATSDLDTLWNDTAPTVSVFTVGTSASTNDSAVTYVAYLFATLAGISKVGSYTGDGTTGKAIACGFAAGARFILIKRTDSTGDWFVFDSVRTYPAGNDYHLSLNTTAAEVVTTDDVDYDAVGFLVNQNATTNLNVTSATYIFLAIA